MLLFSLFILLLPLLCDCVFKPFRVSVKLVYCGGFIAFRVR